MQGPRAPPRLQPKLMDAKGVPDIAKVMVYESCQPERKASISVQPILRGRGGAGN